ncbi:MAG TPA: ferrochelatase, partial [Flavipsychrobacter sp.]|nr:ferrochelatase [Flavipsychrobacter sp.]
MGDIKRGIVLMNLGSPDSTEVKDVRKYLGEFLMDKRVIDSPWLFRLLLVNGIIVPFRSPKSAKAYKKVWTDEGSPLIVLSEKLKDALQSETEDTVVVAMRYGTPSPKQAFDELLQKSPSIEEVVLLPLYPHYAMSSYETAVVYAEEIYRKEKYPFRLKVVPPYYNDPSYINALTESITPFLKQPYEHILFSFHGVPERHIYKGDITGQHCLKTIDCCTTPSPAHEQCYRAQCFATTRLVTERLHISSEKYSVSFQSRLGRAEWLKPYTAMRLAQMPAEGIKKILIVCPAFISDCLETLEEIAQEGRHTFMNAGGSSFT